MMSTSSRKGFTIIEVILFLAISALMMAGVMAGVTGSINRQRYDEANISLLDYMQSQYNLNDNIRNNRPNTLKCDSGGISNGTQARGTSDCTIAGRVIFSDDGKQITSRPVYATSEGLTNPTTEVEYLDSLKLVLAPDTFNEDNTMFEAMWQTELYTDESPLGDNHDFSILILRLPSNGLTKTYVSTTGSFNEADFGDTFWDKTESLGTLNLCVDTSDLTNAPPTGVRVQGGAPTSNGVQFIPAGSGVCS